MDAHASEIRCIASERRLGRFVVDQRQWQRMDLRIARRIQASFLIVAAVPVKDKPYLSVYTAHSHLFDRLEPKQEPPEYRVTTSQDGLRIKAERGEIAEAPPQETALDRMERTLQEVG
jgi:hypothetical protein